MGGFRPFTEYMCAIVATNSQGSGPPATVTAMTNEDGECTCIIVSCTTFETSALLLIIIRNTLASLTSLCSNLALYDGKLGL